MHYLMSGSTSLRQDSPTVKLMIERLSTVHKFFLDLRKSVLSRWSGHANGYSRGCKALRGYGVLDVRKALWSRSFAVCAITFGQSGTIRKPDSLERRKTARSERCRRNDVGETTLKA